MNPVKAKARAKMATPPYKPPTRPAMPSKPMMPMAKKAMAMKKKTMKKMMQ